jgi:putative sigma-54 modulation protein
MKINVQAIHFDADLKLVNFIKNKLERLSKLMDRGEIEVDVHLKLQPTGSAVQQKITEIHVQLPGGWLIDKKSDTTFEGAIMSSVETLKRQLTRRKERLSGH